MNVASFIGEALLGWLLADLIGGVVHWLEDRVLTEQTPLMAGIVRDNRLHHAQPMEFTDGSLWSRNAVSAAVALALSLIWYLAFGPSVMLAAATIGGIVSNEVHCWAHKRPGRVLRVLQDVGIIQSPRMHSGHHRPPETGRYCVLTDWCNPVLDALDFWGRIERLVRNGREAV